ncbi:hypothetical protein DRW48_10400 [Paracoccus suum]|uniref:Toprim domain-containing protein n=1 Tax=Paracoccus suum TaxID=2259340 RepID=A0A344PKZ0_9RHOB|nr:toprim domain-containing protein [Paracoccus suum]AXC50045.1 hypothetical protein DRW48_10400 [Paracoccus suum]
MSVHDAMVEACRAVGIVPPARPVPGRWVLADVEGKANGKGDGRVKLDPDGRGGVSWNHQTGQHARFRDQAAPASPARPRDLAREREQEADRRAVAAIYAALVGASRQERHAYLARKGFPEERGLVLEDARAVLPATGMGPRVAAALPEGEGPLLLIPGRAGGEVTTVQFITAEGIKKNILGGRMGAAAHRIATGRETWVCEGIATALSVRAALRLLGRSATVLSAFSAQNVAKVAGAIPGAIIAADHDKTVDVFGTGTGEHYARQSGCRWVMPPEMGDWNDHHTRHGLRAVALLLREVKPP